MAYRVNSAWKGHDESGSTPKLYERYSADPVPNGRQQGKIVYAVVHNDLASIERSVAFITARDVEQFVSDYFERKDYQERAWELVTKIRPAHELRGPREILEDIKAYPLDRQVYGLLKFAVLRQEVGAEEAYDSALEDRHPDPALVTACARRCPDVVNFATWVHEAIDLAERYNGPEKARQYMTSYRVAAGLLYGKQLEYMDQLLFLEQEAKARADRRARGSASRNDPHRDYKESQNLGAGADSGQNAGRQQGGSYQQRQESPTAERAKPADVGGFSSGGEVKKRKIGENDYENNDTGVGGFVSYIRSMNQVPIVIEGRTDYRIYQTPGTPEYLAKLKTDRAFAESQVEAVAKAVKERVLDAGQVNGSQRSPTSRFHLRMQGLFHPDSMNRYSDNYSTPTKYEKDIRAELFKAYQEIVAKNPDKDFYGLA